MFGVVGLWLGCWTTCCLIGITSILLLYRYSTRNRKFWTSRGVISMEQVTLVSTLYQLSQKPFQDSEYERYFKYGPIYGHFEGTQPFLSVAEPALIRDILVKDFPIFSTRREFDTGDKTADSILIMTKGGENWKRIRSIVTPTFTTGKIKRMLGILKDCSKTVVVNFQNASREGKPIDAKRLYGAFTMDAIASTAFSTKMDSHNQPDNQFVMAAKDVFKMKLNWRILLFFACPKLLKLLKTPVFFPEAMDFFREVTYQIMEERKLTKQVRNDFLQLLMDTTKEAAEAEKPEKADIASNYGLQEEEVNTHMLKTPTSKKLTMEELVAQCVTFFVAGYDTTANTLSLASYHLALDTQIQDRLRREVDEAIRNADGELTYEAIQGMKYLDNVISETLRLYPPIVRLERLSETDYKLGDTGITVPKGVHVTIPIWSIHRDPKYFPEPEHFDPGREGQAGQFCFLPFGAGPRSCVAMRFALVEVKTCLAHVVAHFVIKRCPETKVPLSFKPGQGILQPEGIILEMEIRDDSPLVK